MAIPAASFLLHHSTASKTGSTLSLSKEESALILRGFSFLYTFASVRYVILSVLHTRCVRRQNGQILSVPAASSRRAETAFYPTPDPVMSDHPPAPPDPVMSEWSDSLTQHVTGCMARSAPLLTDPVRRDRHDQEQLARVNHQNLRKRISIQGGKESLRVTPRHRRHVAARSFN